MEQLDPASTKSWAGQLEEGRALRGSKRRRRLDRLEGGLACGCRAGRHVGAGRALRALPGWDDWNARVLVAE